MSSPPSSGREECASHLNLRKSAPLTPNKYRPLIKTSASANTARHQQLAAQQLHVTKTGYYVNTSQHLPEPATTVRRNLQHCLQHSHAVIYQAVTSTSLSPVSCLLCTVTSRHLSSVTRPLLPPIICLHPQRDQFSCHHLCTCQLSKPVSFQFSIQRTTNIGKPASTSLINYR